MVDDSTLDLLDGEEEVAPAARADQAGSRTAFLRRAVLAGGALVGGGVLAAGVPRLASSAPSRAQDRRILNFLLLMEYLQADFYASASAGGALRGELRTFARTVGAHEQVHVAALKKRLGADARAKPTFDFRDSTKDPDKFAATALDLEEMGASAYIGQGANLTNRSVKLVAGIVAVEARHTAWIRDFLEKHPAPRAADPALTGRQVMAAIRKTGFLKGASR
jgi:Ferritin-like domain